MALSRNRRRAAAPSRIRYRSSGQNSTVFSTPASSPAFFSRTPLEKSFLVRPRASWASTVKVRPRLSTIPRMSAAVWSMPIISRSYRARWDRAEDR